MIQFKVLTIHELSPTLLTTFNRYQETNYVCFKANDQFIIKADYFVEHWDDEKKYQVILELQNCVQANGTVTGAFSDRKLIGFANVEGELFGNNKEYLELPYIHVSNEYRNSGIGKKLFQICCEKAKQMGAKKLYIAAHPSVETQHFYKAVGCTHALEINQKILNKEPLDIQLEKVL
ncbi:GNAT family N-acetyltransferase [Cytobacillus dafuensis]|uniref:GNAT family N-acetyltransferase n=1 Tax=Cytobacillus dafuensis TaxID=1742359 RepID=A0A5B8Z185_CYTDA|nr:GNAT family N-acetyltransferase [Cytobacillus dafuensis]QED46571.1 GNAT family N-acetyltransferase [Cytobacillus dafuensis]